MERAPLPLPAANSAAMDDRTIGPCSTPRTQSARERAPPPIHVRAHERTSHGPCHPRTAAHQQTTEPAWPAWPTHSTSYIFSQPTMATHPRPCACAPSFTRARPSSLTRVPRSPRAGKRYIHRYRYRYTTRYLGECVRMYVNMLTPQTVLTPVKFALTPS